MPLDPASALYPGVGAAVALQEASETVSTMPIVADARLGFPSMRLPLFRIQCLRRAAGGLRAPRSATKTLIAGSSTSSAPASGAEASATGASQTADGSRSDQVCIFGDLSTRHCHLPLPAFLRYDMGGGLIGF